MPSVGLAKSVQKHTKKRLFLQFMETQHIVSDWISIVLRPIFSIGRLDLAVERVISHHIAAQITDAKTLRGDIR